MKYLSERPTLVKQIRHSSDSRPLGKPTQHCTHFNGFPATEASTIAKDVYQLPGRPRNTINIYLVDGILVDAGTPQAQKRIFRALGDKAPTAHLVTHAHPHHFGSSHAVCEKYGIDLMCGEKDAGAVEEGRPEASDTMFGRRILSKLPPPPGHPVAGRLKEGDGVGTFEVLDTPGHSSGHIASWPPLGNSQWPLTWRSDDRTLLLADVFFNMNILTCSRVSMSPQYPDSRPCPEPAIGPVPGRSGA